MASSSQHVSYEERCKIDALTKAGLTLSKIARCLGRSKSTTSRALARNGSGRGDRPG